MYAKPSARLYDTVGLETGVVAATPHKLVDMLFDGAQRAIRSALHALESGDTDARIRAVSKATNIVAEGLRGALDLEHGGDLARRLDALYEYITARLIAANLERSAAPLEEALRLLAELHAGWRAIDPATGKGARADALHLAA